ncbi:cytochrome c oxidase assembly protein [Saccharopolyspora rosea]|uniref:cytochrome c oxidase assembly protein n=1 Tax=Saccharopolyspora rosea TaxID=524884 RepID=UPI0021D96F3A|nr:cytochrome c oxidase assembly protein [Saccharopolyspora rosea]
MTTSPMPPLTWQAALTTWQLALGWDLAVLLACVGYLVGLRRLRRAGQEWPRRRAACFAAGLVSIVLATNSSIAAYSSAYFSMHMIQHLTLIMVAPYLLIAAHPLDLWQRAARDPERVRSVLLSRPVSVLTNSMTGFLLYAVVLAATHLTPFMQLMLQHHVLHHVEAVVYLVSGYLCFLAVIGLEPTRWQRLSYPLRLAFLMFAMAPDTGIGVVLMGADHVLFPDFARMSPDGTAGLLDDQRLGGAIMWVGGDGLMALAMLVLAVLWIRSTGPQAGFGDWLESARRSALSGTAGEAGGDVIAESADVDADERALADYNAMLARLNGRTSGGDAR